MERTVDDAGQVDVQHAQRRLLRLGVGVGRGGHEAREARLDHAGVGDDEVDGAEGGVHAREGVALVGPRRHVAAHEHGIGRQRRRRGPGRAPRRRRGWPRGTRHRRGAGPPRAQCRWRRL